MALAIDVLGSIPLHAEPVVDESPRHRLWLAGFGVGVACSATLSCGHRELRSLAGCVVRGLGATWLGGEVELLVFRSDGRQR